MCSPAPGREVAGRHLRGRGEDSRWYARAVCQTEPMDAGTHTIVFDGRGRTLTIFSTVEPPSFLMFEP